MIKIRNMEKLYVSNHIITQKNNDMSTKKR